jgi:excisionase family DNA binding protein
MSDHIKEILTIPEVAAELRCSRAHVYNMVSGKVAGVTALPAISMGRRRLIRRGTLEQWKQANERCPSGGRISDAHSVGAA